MKDVMYKQEYSSATSCSKVLCPFCGTSFDLKVRPDFSEDEPDYIIAYHVECGVCGCKGRNFYPIGWCETEEAAIQAWEHRWSVRPQISLSANATSVLKFGIEPFGPEGQFALYYGRIPNERDGMKFCNLYDFRDGGQTVRQSIVDALNNNAHLKKEGENQ